MHDQETLQLRTILITGVSRGLGRALAERWAQDGHTIVGCARSAGALDELAASLEDTPGRHHWSTVDVSDDGAVAAWIRTVVGAVGVPDLVINNAALINQRAPLWQVPADEFSNIIDVNIKGVVNVIRHVVPPMIEAGRGVIVNLSSGWGQITAPDVAPYCATKFAIEGLTGSLAQELPDGLAAVPLRPGIIHTDMLDTAFGERASEHWTPEEWIDVAAPFILGLGRSHNGKSLLVPDGGGT